MPELIDLYDENRNLIGKTHIRGNPLNAGEHYLVADIWTITPDGKLLIDRRHPQKSYGGMWECTGGVAKAGEDSLSGAVRELGEELGLEVDKSELRLIHSCRRPNKFVDTYLLIKNINLEQLRLQEEEVTEAKLVSFRELEKIIAAGQLSVSSGSIDGYKNVLKRFSKQG